MGKVEKILFLGSKSFGLEILKLLYHVSALYEWEIVCPDDSKDERSVLAEFKAFSKSNNIKFQVAPTLSILEEYVDKFNPCIMVVCGYYQILPKRLLQKVGRGVWGMHNSLLPKYRGGAPLVWQIINGENQLGSSFFKFSEGVDDGEILHQVSIKNNENMTIGIAMQSICEMWKKELPPKWKALLVLTARTYTQDESAATYCAQRKDEDGKVCWGDSAGTIDRFIRAQDWPYPRAFFLLDGKVIRIVAHKVSKRVIYGIPGQIFCRSKKVVAVCCGDNTALDLLMLEVNGEKKEPGDVLKSIYDRI